MKTGTIISESYAKLNRLHALQHYIRLQDLTGCLEVLEKAGYSGELGVFMLAYLQNLEVTA